MAQDLKIQQTEYGYFDLVLGENDLETVDGLETSVATLLFTDARAESYQVADPVKRRGWVGNILRNSDLGGMLWLMQQTRNDQETRNNIVEWAKNSLQPLFQDDSVSDITVTATPTGVRGIELLIDIVIRDGDTVLLSYWLDTDLGGLANAN